MKFKKKKKKKLGWGRLNFEVNFSLGLSKIEVEVAGNFVNKLG